MAETDDVATAREMVAQSCRILGGLDLTKASTGHVSQRHPDGEHILIRARGPAESGVRYTKADEVITIDLAGNKVDGPSGLAPPHETILHTTIYRRRPDVNCVVHVHPPTVILFTICDKPLLPLYCGYDPSSLDLVLDGIPTYQCSLTVTNDKLANEFCDVLGEKRAALMRGHGVTTVGGEVQTATLTAIRLNELAEMNYRAYMLGNPQPISDEDIAAFKAKRPKGGGAKKGPSPRHAAVWRYYVELTSA
jgi:ribulose-5-phosphate 4-epimerase/fuculose-1-phosphate aldolase